MDFIEIKNVKVFAHHGVYPEESAQGQDFYVSIRLHTDTRDAGLQDDLERSVDYGELCLFADEFMKRNTYKLLEAVTENLAREILLKYPKLHGVEVTVSKPHAPIPLSFEDVSVSVFRAWHEAYLALGSNMGDRKGYILDALEKLENEKDILVEQVSGIIETKAYGGVAEDDFLNGVVRVRTLQTPYELLSLCRRIEDAADRKREVRWGPRTLDLDILFYDKEIIEDAELTVPHPDMKNRDFVLEPMAEIAPGFVHPVYRMTMTDMLQAFRKKE